MMRKGAFWNLYLLIVSYFSRTTYGPQRQKDEDILDVACRYFDYEKFLKKKKKKKTFFFKLEFCNFCRKPLNDFNYVGLQLQQWRKTAN